MEPNAPRRSSSCKNLGCTTISLSRSSCPPDQFPGTKMQIRLNRHLNYPSCILDSAFSRHMSCSSLDSMLEVDVDLCPGWRTLVSRLASIANTPARNGSNGER